MRATNDTRAITTIRAIRANMAIRATRAARATRAICVRFITFCGKIQLFSIVGNFVNKLCEIY